MDITIMNSRGFIGIVSAADLEDLIRNNEILAFMRSDGWARVGMEPMRKSQQPFAGEGRRAEDRSGNGFSTRKEHYYPSGGGESW